MTEPAALILAAGKGTRMKSNRAKVTFPIADKPMVQRVADSASKAGCARICVVVGYQKESVIACLENDKRLEFVEQTEQLGTGHAVMMARPLFTDPDQDVLILSGDVPLLSAQTLQRMHQEHLASGSVCTVLTAVLDDPGKYGRILRDADGRIRGIMEFKDASESQRSIREWNTGIYCFRSGDLFHALDQISNANQQQEYYLTDVVAILHQAGKKVAGVELENLVEVAGVNSQEQLAALEDQFVDAIRKRWLNNGVMIHNPQTVFIGDDVVLEQDAEVCQNTVIKGHSQICAGAHIGPGCFLADSYVSDNAILEGHNVLVDAHIPEGHILEFGEQVIEETFND
ncbi:MAG: NTP transferase domain-containing protein [Candidatus Cloacimonetes bacterium]|jgi:bifunctional UDP-N-acetylglucosamine pyrophosphorylase/glucosamine-1-phosphate N-acetyltransferase|nr:NTP transferase domain-containing protein [Candidatus Cloacimonadota bacterium]MDY0367503.1 NTP transferase domain-containing protein [Candidatus Syntrophosphaera sp.]